jgi:hypothetical protein
MPLSEIVNRNAVGTEQSASGVTRRDTSPVSVNLIALPSKLSSTCRSRVGSPTRPAGHVRRDLTHQGQPFFTGPARHHLRHLL